MRKRIIGVTVSVLLLMSLTSAPALAAGTDMRSIVDESFDTYDAAQWRALYCTAYSSWSESGGSAWVSDGMVHVRPPWYRGATALESRMPITQLPAKITFAQSFPSYAYRQASFFLGPGPMTAKDDPYYVDWRYGNTDYSGGYFALALREPDGATHVAVQNPPPILPVNTWLVGEMTLYDDRIVATINGVTLEVPGDVRAALNESGELYPHWRTNDDLRARGQDIDWVRIEQDQGDSVAPVVTATLSGAEGANGWYTSDVSVALHATDDVSGVDSVEYSLDGGATWTGYAAPIVVGAQGASSLTYRATDVAGNVSAPGSVSFKIDSIAPAVTIVTPASGARYVLRSSTTVDWGATDGGSGIADVVATAPDGTPLDTSAAGSATFVVTATDGAGNRAQASSVYAIVCDKNTSGIPASGLYSRSRTLPVKFWLYDASGLPVADAAARLTVAPADARGKVIGDRVKAPADPFRANPDGLYRTNLRLSRLTGDYHVAFVEFGDGTEASFFVSFRTGQGGKASHKSGSRKK